MERKVIYAPKRRVPIREDDPPQKRAKNAPLHDLHVVPFSFLEDAVSNPEKFLGTGEVGGTFGIHGEAYFRQCHRELLAEIMKEIEKWRTGNCMRMVEVRGSSGIGKSTFLACAIAHMKLHCDTRSFAIFHTMGHLVDEVRCSVWIDGQLKVDKGLYADVKMRQKILVEYMPKLGAIFMDKCSPTIPLDAFTGLLVVAAPPSVSTEGKRSLLDAKKAWEVLYMPPWTLDESLAAGRLLGTNEDVIRDNFRYMPGMLRYCFHDGAARRRVSRAVKNADPDLISSVEAGQHSDHSLLRWEVEKNTDGSYRYREMFVSKWSCDLLRD